jgi:uncharacterized RDD family membrane protein YckC
MMQTPRAMRNRGMLGQYAGFVTRAVALIIDMLIVIALTLVVYWSIRLPVVFFLGVNPDTCTASSTQSVLAQFGAMLFPAAGRTPQWLCDIVDLIWKVTALLAAPVYFIFFYSSTGQTIGMYVLGIRIVRLDGKHMTLWTSIVRWIGLFLSAVPLGLGFFWVIIDDRRQGWQDKLAHTCVVYAWRAEEDNFIISRFKRWLWGDRARRMLGDRNTAALRPAGLPKLDLLTIAFPNYDRLDDVLDIIQNGIADEIFHIVNATVLVKGDGDAVGVLAASDLAVGTKVSDMADEPLMLPDYELKRIMADVPAQHFVVAVVLEDHYGDDLVRAISREASALVRRFDLDEPSKAIKTPQQVSISKAARPHEPI